MNVRPNSHASPPIIISTGLLTASFALGPLSGLFLASGCMRVSEDLQGIATVFRNVYVYVTVLGNRESVLECKTRSNFLQR